MATTPKPAARQSSRETGRRSARNGTLDNMRDKRDAGHKVVKSEVGVDLTSKGASSAPSLPHERDQAVGATAETPNPRVAQGAKDLERGIQDTSRTPEANRTYQKLKK